MKKICFGLLVLASVSAYAENSIILNIPDSTGFGIDTYEIPSLNGESAEQSLLALVNVLPRDACFSGEANLVKAMLDATSASAKNLRKYSSFVSDNRLSVDLTVYNKNIRRDQKKQLIIEQCRQ